METKTQTFKCPEISEYDQLINEQSHNKIQSWIEKYSNIKVGDIVEYNNKKFLIEQIHLLGSEYKYSFKYTVKPVRKDLNPIKNRKSFIVNSVIKDGILYENPSYNRELYSAAQLRQNDYYYKHGRK